MVQRDENGLSVPRMFFSMVTRALVKRSTRSTGNPWPNCSPRPERTPPISVTLSGSSSCGNAIGKRRDEILS